MQFRIGINLGDVIQEKERIYGDGVNIAARLEGLAVAGGICISKTAFDQIESKLPYGYEFLGDQPVKNIAKPVGAYRVLMEPRVTVAGDQEKEKPAKVRRMPILVGVVAVLVVAIVIGIWKFYMQAPSVSPASIEKMAFPLPDKPSIAVLPFTNMSGDSEQEYFSDGITEDLITDLSQISGLLVISRNSSFTYKGKAVKIRTVAEELGVRYILEGSVRKAGENVRISAQLIDATTGGHMWAKRYDGKLVDVFALQDQITKKIIAAMTVKLTSGEQQQIESKETVNIEAYDTFLKGWGHYLRFTPEDFAKAVDFFKEATRLDSKYGRAYAALALTYKKASDLHWNIDLGVSWIEACLLARQNLQKALQYPTSLAHQVASDMNLNRRQHNEAISAAELATTMDPNDPNCQAQMARALIFGGSPSDAVDFVNSAMRLDPSNPARYLFLDGLAQFAMGQPHQSVTLIERALKYNPEAHVWATPLAAAYAHIGRDQEAQTACAKFKKAYGGSIMSTLRRIMYFWPFKDPEVVHRFVGGVVNAGFPGHHAAYYTASDNYRLSGKKIKNLVFDQAVITYNDPIIMGGGGTLIVHSKEGTATYWKGPVFLDPELARFESEGTSLIEGDLLCYQWQELIDGHMYCGPVFINPQGTSEGRDEYLFVTDFDVILFSLVTGEKYELVKENYSE
jgi:TolB-like protein/Flp pilus assembly protein TadD